MHLEAATKCIPSKPNQKVNVVPWESKTVWEKRDNLEKASLPHRRNPTNTNVQKLKKLSEN